MIDYNFDVYVYVDIFGIYNWNVYMYIVVFIIVVYYKLIWVIYN